MVSNATFNNSSVISWWNSVRNTLIDLYFCCYYHWLPGIWNNVRLIFIILSYLCGLCLLRTWNRVEVDNIHPCNIKNHNNWCTFGGKGGGVNSMTSRIIWIFFFLIQMPFLPNYALASVFRAKICKATFRVVPIHPGNYLGGGGLIHSNYISQKVFWLSHILLGNQNLSVIHRASQIIIL